MILVNLLVVIFLYQFLIDKIEKDLNLENNLSSDKDDRDKSLKHSQK